MARVGEAGTAGWTESASLLRHARHQQGLFPLSLLVWGLSLTVNDTQVVQATTLKSSLLQGVVLVSALAIKPLLTRSGQGENGLASILFHVRPLHPSYRRD